MANEGTAIFNNGTTGGRDDVVVYMSVDDDVDPKFAPSFCVRRKKIGHLEGWNAAGPSLERYIAGYRWVTDRECRAARDSQLNGAAPGRGGRAQL